MSQEESTPKGKLRGFSGWLINQVGHRVIDRRTGELLGRALILAWGGRIHLVGYTGEKPVVPVFVPLGKTCYWRQSIGFEVRESPDFEPAAEDDDKA